MATPAHKPPRKRRFRRPRWGPTAWLLLVFVLALLRLFSQTARNDALETLDEGEYAVRYVIDGDTFVLENNARVRLQGIDTPEVAREGMPGERWSDEATLLTRGFVEAAGGRVALTFGAERRDRYGRALAFVWDGEVMLNEQLVLAGLAKARPDYRFSGRMKRRLLAAQDQARAARRGIWSKE